MGATTVDRTFSMARLFKRQISHSVELDAQLPDNDVNGLQYQHDAIPEEIPEPALPNGVPTNDKTSSKPKAKGRIILSLPKNKQCETFRSCLDKLSKEQGLGPWSYADINRALFIMARNARRLPPKCDGAQTVDDFDFIERAEDLLEYAMGSYTSNLHKLRKKIRLRGHTIACEGESCPFYPAYGMIIEHSQNRIIWTIRGTETFNDVVTDLLVTPEHVFCGVVHGGMFRAACNLLNKKKDDVARILEENPDMKLYVTGHSLGAGVASILSMLLRSMGIECECYAFAPPCCMSITVARGCAPYVHSFIFANDIVPRLSLAHLEELRLEIVHLDWMTILGFQEARAIRKMGANVDWQHADTNASGHLVCPLTSGSRRIAKSPRGSSKGPGDVHVESLDSEQSPRGRLVHRSRSMYAPVFKAGIGARIRAVFSHVFSLTFRGRFAKAARPVEMLVPSQDLTSVGSPREDDDGIDDDGPVILENNFGIENIQQNDTFHLVFPSVGDQPPTVIVPAGYFEMHAGTGSRAAGCLPRLGGGERGGNGSIGNGSIGRNKENRLLLPNGNGQQPASETFPNGLQRQSDGGSESDGSTREKIRGPVLGGGGMLPNGPPQGSDGGSGSEVGTHWNRTGSVFDGIFSGHWHGSTVQSSPWSGTDSLAIPDASTVLSLGYTPQPIRREQRLSFMVQSEKLFPPGTLYYFTHEHKGGMWGLRKRRGTSLLQREVPQEFFAKMPLTSNMLKHHSTESYHMAFKHVRRTLMRARVVGMVADPQVGTAA